MDRKLVSLKTQIRSCEKCPLYELTPCGPVPGIGKRNSKAFFVNERVDSTQATILVPFGGNDSDYIKNILSRAKLNYKEYFYTSLNKCSDTNHDYPKNKFAKICSDWVYEEIDEHNPDYVFCMGMEVLYRLLPECKRNWKLKDVIGKQYSYRNTIFVPLYSLSFLKEYGIKKTQEVVEVISGILKE